MQTPKKLKLTLKKDIVWFVILNNQLELNTVKIVIDVQQHMIIIVHG